MWWLTLLSILHFCIRRQTLKIKTYFRNAIMTHPPRPLRHLHDVRTKEWRRQNDESLPKNPRRINLLSRSQLGGRERTYLDESRRRRSGESSVRWSHDPASEKAAKFRPSLFWRFDKNQIFFSISTSFVHFTQFTRIKISREKSLFGSFFVQN